jgi:periodic tryptophan protein 2
MPCYSADGTCILGGGNTKWVCIYNVARRMCIKKFAVSSNKSLDGVLNQVVRKRQRGGERLGERDRATLRETESGGGETERGREGDREGERSLLKRICFHAP